MEPILKARRKHRSWRHKENLGKYSYGIKASLQFPSIFLDSAKNRALQLAQFLFPFSRLFSFTNVDLWQVMCKTRALILIIRVLNLHWLIWNDHEKKNQQNKQNRSTSCTVGICFKTFTKVLNRLKKLKLQLKKLFLVWQTVIDEYCF